VNRDSIMMVSIVMARFVYCIRNSEQLSEGYVFRFVTAMIALDMIYSIFLGILLHLR
jgi:hypothetical protein